MIPKSKVINLPSARTVFPPKVRHLCHVQAAASDAERLSPEINCEAVKESVREDLRPDMHRSTQTWTSVPDRLIPSSLIQFDTSELELQSVCE